MGLVQLTADVYARIQYALLPPGRLWKLLGESVLGKVFLAAGDELERAHARVADMIREADPRTTDELLPDFEKTLDLVRSSQTHALDLEAGSNQYAEAAASPDLGVNATLTLEAWAKIESVGGHRTLVSTYESTGSQKSWIFRLTQNSGNDVLELHISEDGDDLMLAQTDSIASPVGEWHHFAVSFDGNEAVGADRFAFYVDGEQVAHSIVSGSVQNIFHGTAPLRLGAGDGAGGLFDGLLADVRLWDILRTGEEIAFYRGTDISPATAGLVGLWLKDDSLVDGGYQDHSQSGNHPVPANGPVFTEADLPYGSKEERRAAVVAHLVGRQGVRVVDFQQALALLLNQAAEDVVVIEISRAEAVVMGDDREKFRFFVYRDPQLAGTYDLEAAQVVIDRMKLSHTEGHAIESMDFLCDDQYSLCDRDILGDTTSKSLLLDTSLDQYAESAAVNLALGQSATWEAWVHVTEAFATHAIVGQWGETNLFSLRLVGPGDAGHLQVDLDGMQIRATIADITNGWHHVAVTWDGTQAVAADRFVVYLDGAVIAHSVFSGSVTTIASAAVPIRVGTHGSAGGVDHFDGYLADVRVWGVIRSLAEIQAGMTLPPAPDEAGLHAMYYQIGVHEDLSDGAHDLTAVNGATFDAEYPS